MRFAQIQNAAAQCEISRGEYDSLSDILADEVRKCKRRKAELDRLYQEELVWKTVECERREEMFDSEMEQRETKMREKETRLEEREKALKTNEGAVKLREAAVAGRELDMQGAELSRMCRPSLV